MAFEIRTLSAGATVWRCYDLKFGYDSFNPGLGDTRFAPIQTPVAKKVPTMYAGEDEIAALLETVVHDIHQDVGERVIYEADVRKSALVSFRLPRSLALVDLRDDALAALNISREQIVSTTAEHYPCTREWAAWLHEQKFDGAKPEGIVWHSRQAELRGGGHPREAYMFFGDRAPSTPGAYPLADKGVGNLTEGRGLLLLERLAEKIDARIEPAID